MKSTIVTAALLLSVLIPRSAVSGDAANSPEEQKTIQAMPVFSWDKIPRWGFLSFRGEAVTDEEADYIVKNFPLICLYWLPGGPPAENRIAEQMMFASSEKVKNLNPGIKILYYWNATLAYNFYRDFTVFEHHPEWMLKDKSGKSITVRDAVLRYDVANPELRDWWADHAAAAAAHPFIDGIFADAVAKIELHKTNVFDERKNEGDFEQSVAGMHEMLAMTKQKIGNGKILIFNGLRGDMRPGMWAHGGMTYMNEADGACMEHFLVHSVRAPDGKLRINHVLRDIELIREASAKGKLVLVKAWPKTATFLDPEFQNMTEEQKKRILREEATLPLALFLIAAENNCYINYNFGYRRECLPLGHIPEFDRPLGPPLGRARQNGLVLTRNFEHAEVEVNLSTEEARINWK